MSTVAFASFLNVIIGCIKAPLPTKAPYLIIALGGVFGPHLLGAKIYLRGPAMCICIQDKRKYSPLECQEMGVV